MFNYNTIEVILFWSLFAFGVFAVFYWQKEPSIALGAFTLVAIFGYSKLHKTWLLEDEIERLESLKEVRERRDAEQKEAE